MKKFLLAILALALIASLAACSGQETTATGDAPTAVSDSLIEFIERHERESVEDLKGNPGAFVDDLVAVFLAGKEKNFENCWYDNSQQYNGVFYEEVVFFGIPTCVGAARGKIGEETAYVTSPIFITFDNRDDLAIPICEAVFRKYGRAKKIIAEHDEEITEFDLRREWDEEEYEFSIIWETMDFDIMIGCESDSFFDEIAVYICIAEDLQSAIPDAVEKS